MERLIDANKLMDTILLQDGVNTKTWEQVFKFTIRAIDNAPTIDPFERIGAICNENCGVHIQPRGKWIVAEDCEYVMKCSNCNEDAEYLEGGSQFLSKYCPNCGAKMDNAEG